MTAERVLKKFRTDVKRVLGKHLPRIIAEQTQIAGKEMRRRPIVVGPVEIKPVEPKIEAKPVTDLDYLAAMHKHGSKRAAAKALGIPETTFRERYNKITKPA